MKQSATIRRPVRPIVPRAALASAAHSPAGNSRAARGEPGGDSEGSGRGICRAWDCRGSDGCDRAGGARQQGAALLLLQGQGRTLRSGAGPCVQRAAGAGDAGARKQTAAAAEDAGISGGVFRLHRGESAVSAGGAGGVDAVGRRQRADAAGGKGIFPSNLPEAGRFITGGH